MEFSLNALVEELDDLFFERATRDYRVASGLQRGLERVRAHDDLTRSPELFQYLGELVQSPRTDEGKRARLVLLRRYAARTWVEAKAADAHEEQAKTFEGTTFTANARSWTIAEALHEVSRLAQREARVLVERELTTALLAHTGVVARSIDAQLQAAHALGQPMSSLVELMHGRQSAPRLEAASTLLKQTADAWFDLLGYALKRLDPQLTRRTASWHDVTRAVSGPWLFESFRREDLHHAVTRTMSDLGFNPSAEGRITVDSEMREGRSKHNQVFELRVPDQVRLLLTPDGGFGAYASWLSCWGRALHRVHVGRALPFVERRLGDPAVVAGFAQVFESLLLEEGWLKRYLRLTSAQAREAVRLFAFRQLFELRRAAAVALTHRVLSERGAVPEVAEELTERLKNTVGTDVSASQGWLELDSMQDALLDLDAFALAAVLRHQLTERCNEDFYRNPAAGRVLADFASRGQRDDAVAAAKAMADASLDLVEAGRWRVALMGA